MPGPEFFVAIDASLPSLSGGTAPDDLLRVITIQALHQAGVRGDVDGIVEAVRTAMRQMSPNGSERQDPYRLQFSVDDRQLTILLTVPGGRTWRQSHRIS